MKRFLYLFFFILLISCGQSSRHVGNHDYLKSDVVRDSISIIIEDNTESSIQEWYLGDVVESDFTNSDIQISSENQNVMGIGDQVFYDSVEQSVQNNKYEDQDNSLSGTPPLNIGKINYLINDTMVVNKTTEVYMTIDRGIDQNSIITEIKTFRNGEVYTDKIRISNVMSAELIDPTGENFIIKPITPVEQIIEDVGYTKWRWDVTPLIEGENSLSLSVNIIVNNTSKNIRVYDGVIYVYSEESWFKRVLIPFWINNWEWIIGLLTAVVIPIIGYLYKKIKKRKNTI